jgi:hypothetical protein
MRASTQTFASVKVPLREGERRVSAAAGLRHMHWEAS